MQLPKQKKNEDKIAMKTCDTMWRGMQKLSLSILEKKKRDPRLETNTGATLTVLDSAV